MSYDGPPPATPTAPALPVHGRSRVLSVLRTDRFTRHVPDAFGLAGLYRMARRLVPVTILDLLFSLAAYSGDMEEHKFRPSSRPRLRYTLELEIQDARGPFDRLSALAQFDVINAKCLPEQAIPGARITPRKQNPISLFSTTTGKYEGAFYLDADQDDNYFDLGVCYWSLTSINVLTTKRRIPYTIHVISESDKISQSSKRYFSKKIHENLTSHFVDNGSTAHLSIKNPKTAFSIEATIRESSLFAKI